MKKKLLKEDEQSILQETKAIEIYCKQVNLVLESFVAFQDFQAISPVNVDNVLKDPVSAFDNVILKASGLKMAKDPEATANLMGINRTGYLNAITVEGLYRGERNLRLFTFSPVFQKTLNYTPEDNTFSVNRAKLENHLDCFRVYIENDEEYKLFSDLQNLCKSLTRFSVEYDIIRHISESNIKMKIGGEKNTGKDTFSPDLDYFAEVVVAMRQNKT